MASALLNRRSRWLFLVALLFLGLAVVLLSPNGDDSEQRYESAAPAAVGPFVKSESATSPFPALASDLSAGLNRRQLAGQRIVTGFQGRTVPPVIRRRIRA